MAQVNANFRRCAALQDTDTPATPIERYRDLRIDLGAREVRIGERAVALTAREFDLLVHFVRHPERAYSCALLISARLTRRLRRRMQRVEDYCVQTIGEEDRASHREGDEITRLTRAFDAMQARIDQQIAQIRNSDSSRRELVAHVSHDLRTPLTNIQGHIETLVIKHNSLDTDAQRRYLDVVRRHTLRLGRLVDDLFELARLDAGIFQPERDLFSLAELIPDITQEYRLNAERKGITLWLERHTDESTIDADIRLTEGVITNLLDNTLRHTPAGGEILLSVAGGRTGVCVCIADNASGILARDLPQVFERGFHSTPASHDRPASSGLGLAIVRRILALHGGDITVRSLPGAGIEFCFALPRAAVPAAEPTVLRPRTDDTDPVAEQQSSDVGGATLT